MALADLIPQILSEYAHVEWEPCSSGCKLKCIFHDDKNPSAVVFARSQEVSFKCYACNHETSIFSYLSKLLDKEVGQVIIDLETRFGYEKGGVIDVEVVEKYHKDVWNHPQLLQALYDRKITDSLIRRHRIGTNSGRLQIPVFNAHGMCVNIRKYLPGADRGQKMRNQAGFGKRPRLFPINQITYDTLVICGGEIKAIAAASVLNEHGIGAVTTTSGEGDWPLELNYLLKGKKLYVCGDVDEPGVRGAIKRCSRLKNIAEWIGLVRLPLDKEKHPKGDINDFLAEGGDLNKVIEETEEWNPSAVLVDEEMHSVDVPKLTSAKFIGKKVSFRASPTAVQPTPFATPKVVCVSCDRSQNVCAVCPIAARSESIPEIELDTSREYMLELVECPTERRDKVIQKACEIPSKCKVVTFQIKEFQTVEVARISSEFSMDSTSSGQEMRPAIFVGGEVTLNETYAVEGRIHPHPKTQAITVVGYKYEPVEDSLATYADVDREALAVFQCRPVEDAIESKLKEIYKDFACNVTRIFLRPDMHFVMDLAYYSPLQINFDDQTVKGWVETLVIGDSAQGKTETASGLQKHYRLGERVDCKNATAAGLVGGLQQLDKRWFVTWGVIPTNDRKLVILEELKGLDVETISKMTDMRSSGVAQLPKIDRRKKLARTRLICLSNPRDGRNLEDRSKGVFAVKDLLGSLEDVRRFDVTLGISASALDPTAISLLQLDPPKYPHTYTSDLSRSLILFAWTRRADQIKVVDRAHLIKESSDLVREYGCPDIPLIDSGSIRFKILRLATALACRLFSVDDDLNVVVYPGHVNFICEFLKRIYSDTSLDYLRFARSKKSDTLHDYDVVQRFVLNIPYAKDFVTLCLENNTGYTIEDIQDWTTWDKDMSREFISFLVRKGAIRRRSLRYFNSPSFNTMLKTLMEAGDFPTDKDYPHEREGFSS